MKKTLTLLFASATIITACNQNKKEDATYPGPVKPATEAAPTTQEDARYAIVDLTAGDDMKFNTKEIRVKAGQTVKLSLTHTGTMKSNVMGHNFVLLDTTVSFEGFVEESNKAQDNGYLSKSMEKDIIAHTKLLGGGERDEIEFPAPKKGTYDFLCSFPGHAAIMRGKFIVE